MKKASSILAFLVLVGISAGLWLASRRLAAPAATDAPAPLTAQVHEGFTKPHVRLIHAATRKVSDLDTRDSGKDGTPLLNDRLRALARLRAAIPGATVDFDPITGAPSQIQATGRFLTQASAGSSPREVVSRFIDQHAALFGHGSAALKSARLTRDDVTQLTGMSTVVWTQEVAGIPLFKTILKANISRNGELITLNDHFVADPAPNRASPAITARKAISLAAASVESSVAESGIVAQGEASGPERLQSFKAPGLSDTTAQLTYLPMNESAVRLGWDVTLFSISTNEMFRAVVDAESGAVLYRTTLTADISNASYRVYADASSKKPADSPLPMTPGHATPLTTEPAEMPRQLLTLPALDTAASPGGWIADGNQETLGNNVDAHADTDANNQPDLPRPNGGVTRTFDTTASMASAPSLYKDASVIHLFYVCNWIHDRFYQLGFTESAGNFQTDNFGRGGLGNDALQADAQDGSGTNNANFSTPPDGSAGRMQMYVWTNPEPDRDSSLDAHIIIHEYTHGLSNRLVGGGVGITNWQTAGMGEGWSDFYALCLLSDPSQDPNGTYPMGPYSSRLLSGVVNSNYYFGIRRYPYGTDMGRSPLTFKDIDYAQASPHTDVPLSPRFSSSSGVAGQVHAIGEVWCSMLWEVRAGLMAKRGAAAGNERVLQLVTDAMKLSPANPNFIQARDAILQADLVLSGGADATVIMTAFAKRGLGVEASSPGSNSISGVVESFDLPDALKVTPFSALAAEATRITGPTFPNGHAYGLQNTGSTPLSWTASNTQGWLTLAPASGTLAAGASVTVTATLGAGIPSMPAGAYEDTLTFTNTASGVTRTRTASLRVNPLLARAAAFSLDEDPLWQREGEWAFGTPTGAHPELGAREPSSGYTGSNVFGVALTGAYHITPGNFSYLTSGPINTTGMSNVTLRFKRWLNEQWQPAAYATIDVSNDGINWTNVWQNTSFENIVESGWSTQTHKLGAVADNKPSIYVRWGHRVGSTAAGPMGGWNIDDVEFLSETTTPGLAATPVTLTTAINTPVSFTLAGTNAANPAAPLTVTLLATAAHGTLSGTLPNLTYTPEAGYSGVETIPFTVSNGSQTSAPACVMITVQPGPPDIAVEFPDGVDLTSGSSAVSLGSLPVGSSVLSQFRIRNVSGGPLSLLSIGITGTHGMEFTPAAPAQSLLAPGASATMTVTWTPLFPGTKTAVLRIASNDPDEGSFSITLNGSATTFDGGVRLTRDLNLGNASINSLRNVRGSLLFIATDNTNDATLWTSLGTPETTRSADEVMSPGSAPSGPVQLTLVGSRAMFYCGFGSGSAIGLWTSDGTLAGSFVSATNDFYYPNYPTSFAGVGETLFFVAADSSTQGNELWKSDGSNAGTVLVKNINPASGASSSIGNMRAFNNSLWFTANDGTRGLELWKSDGTDAGTSLVLDIEAGSGSSSPSNLTAAGPNLFFVAGPLSLGPELYKSDGTVGGTALVKDIWPGSSASLPSSLLAVGNTVLFAASDGICGTELWKSDGTAAGTVLVKDIYAGSGGSGPVPRVVVNGTVYFTAFTASTGTELWKTDGTDAGTVLVKDIYLGSTNSSPQNFVQAGSVAYFTATDPTRGNELWKTDGTAAGTVLVSDLNTGTASSNPANLTVVGTQLYFTATTTATGTELFVLDLGPAPEIAIRQPAGAELADGDSLPFATQPVGAETTKTLLIQNLGTQPLIISETNLVGADPSAFKLAPSLVGTRVPAGRSVALGITFNSSVAASKTATLQIVSNDTDEAVFDIVLSGAAATAPEIAVEGPANASLLDDVSTVMVGDAPLGLSTTQSFTVRNVGSSVLTLGSVSIDGGNAAAFSSSSLAVSSLAPGASTAFTVTFSPGAQGMHRAALHLSSSDADEGSFDITLTGVGSFAPGPLKLQRDLNRQGAGTATTAGIVFNGSYYFPASTTAAGTELWKTNGTEAGTVMLKDIAAGTTSSTPSNFTLMGGVLYFTANDGSNGGELWRTDGTSGGTTMVKNINTAAGASASPGSLVVMNGTLYFSATEASTGTELWKSDGTAGGTVLVQDITTGTGSSFPAQLTVLGGAFYFSATDGVNGLELWRSDGTTPGTVMVKDINTTAANTGSSVAAIRAVGSQILFTANDGTHGTELWRSDGTAPGTSLVLDISPGSAGSSFFLPTASGSLLYFVTQPTTVGGFNNSGQELWRSDGTAAGTFMAVDVKPGSGSSGINSLIADAVGGVYLSANDGVNGTELWRSDGSAVGSAMVRDISPGTSSASPGSLSLINGVLYFSATTSTAGAELWRSDGTHPGTSMVREMNAGEPGSAPANIVSLDGLLILTASNGGDGGEMWAMSTEGAAPRLLRDGTAGSASSSPNNLRVVGDHLCFMATQDHTGAEMWTDDGSGPVLLRDIKPGIGSGVSNTTPVLVELMLENSSTLTRTLYFAGDDGVLGSELWKTDGTPEGTAMVKDIYAGGFPSTPTSLINVSGRLFFAASSSAGGNELWTSDGTESGTQQVANINTLFEGSGSSTPARLTAIGATVFFSASDGINGTELWKSDGSSAGTMMVKDITPGSGSTTFGNFATARGLLFFVANDGSAANSELWVSDGSSAGTYLVMDINTTASTSSAIVSMAACNDVLVFNAFTSTYGNELWRSDGTSAGTFLLKDIHAGSSHSLPGNFKTVGSALYFTAATPANGVELWKTDGTASGTVLVKDIFPGTSTSVPSGLADINGTLYFSAAASAAEGAELWKSDGTSAGTTLVVDVRPGTGLSSSPANITALGSRVFFSATGTDTGVELFSLNLNPEPKLAVTSSLGAALLDNVSTVNFGTLPAGQSGQQVLTLTNQGDAALVLTSATLTGLHGADFTLSNFPSQILPSGTASLMLTFTPAAAGVRTAAFHIYSNDSSASPFDMALTGTRLSSYEMAVQAAGLPPGSTNSEPQDDYDGDGISNLLELAFGTPVCSPLGGSLRLAATNIAAAGQPIAIRDGSGMRAVYLRRIDAATLGITYQLQFSSNLALWETSTTTPTVMAQDATQEAVSVPFPANVGGEPARFFRVNVDLAP